jgi:hypothetical protein
MAILRGVSSRHLPCGCLVGVYETYEGEIVAIIDAPGRACVDPAHREGNSVPNEATQAPHRASALPSRD